MIDTSVFNLATQLIEMPSITPDDGGCQIFIANFLKQLGFEITELPFGKVKNLWAVYGKNKPLFVFAGHTDVVPPGPLELWKSDPFKATVRDNKLFGRGATDMKGNIAAMLMACKNFLTHTPTFNGQIAFLITSDEEGAAIDGTQKVVHYLKQQNIQIDYCLVGEPSSEDVLGDTIKIGRRGSLSGTLIIHGKQGHIAYPHLADNPIHKALKALQDLIEYHWDDGNDDFQATQFQISNIHGGSGANNIIPAELSVHFNFRYSSEQSAEKLQLQVESLLQKYPLNYNLHWHHSGKPFIGKSKNFALTLQKIIAEATGVSANFSTSGGTSDGRFLIDISNELLEFGLTNASIHKVNEYVNLDDLDKLAVIYQKLLRDIFKLNN